METKENLVIWFVAVFFFFLFLFFVITFSIFEIKVIVRIDVFRFLGLIETLPVQGESRLHITLATTTCYYLLSLHSCQSTPRSLFIGSEKQKNRNMF